MRAVFPGRGIRYGLSLTAAWTLFEPTVTVKEGGAFHKLTKRRRGSVLVASLIVMLVLAILSGGVFAFAYVNYKSAEQQRGIMMARAAAESLLYSVGVVISDDFARNPADIKIPFPSGKTLSASFEDGPVSTNIHLSMKENRICFLTASAQYGEWQSGERSLEIVKKDLVSGVSSEWIWR